MRDIEEKMVRAIQDKKSFTLDNTKVIIQDDNTIEVLLHNNLIARIKIDGSMLLFDGGYQSSTTKNRLNALLYGRPQKIYQKNYCWYVTDTIKNKTILFEDINTLNLQF